MHRSMILVMLLLLAALSGCTSGSDDVRFDEETSNPLSEEDDSEDEVIPIDETPRRQAETMLIDSEGQWAAILVVDGQTVVIGQKPAETQWTVEVPAMAGQTLEAELTWDTTAGAALNLEASGPNGTHTVDGGSSMAPQSPATLVLEDPTPGTWFFTMSWDETVIYAPYKIQVKLTPTAP